MWIILEIIVMFLRIFYYQLESLFRLVVPPATKNIRGKVAIVTGAGRGIGQAIAVELAKRGAVVAILDINENTCAETAQRIVASGGSASGYRCDVSKTQEVSAVFDKVRDELGEIDILVNNAGVLPCRNILDLSEAEIRRTLEVNTIAQFWTVKAVLPAMIARKNGHIVTICSMAAKESTQFATDYCASKWGTNGFCEALADDLRHMKITGITLTTVYPLFVNTAMFTDVSQRVEVRSRFDKLMPVDEVGLAIVDGIVQNQRYIYIPSFMKVVDFFMLFPPKARVLLKNFLRSGFYEIEKDKTQ